MTFPPPPPPPPGRDDMADPMDSDSDVEVETSAEDEAAIMQLEEQLQSNPYQIKVHHKVRPPPASEPACVLSHLP